VVGRHNDPYLLGLEVLSPRERQVFELLSESFGNKELMESLNISLPTVKQYKSEVMYKLRLRSLAELITLYKFGS
jgi:DNA-binding CsgD family transcriptional regulator